MKRRKNVLHLVTMMALLAGAATLGMSIQPQAQAQAQSQGKLDRTKIPPPGNTPQLHVPAWTRQTLANGATLIVSERHELPLISFTITFLGGANQFDPPGKRGAGSMTAAMLNEGTATRTGDQLSDALQLLGTSVGAAIGGESGEIGFVSTHSKMDATLAILGDMMLNPSFPADALERLRARTLVSLAQAKSQPAAIGAKVFARVLYGTAHPYGITVTEESVKAITRDDIVALHKAYYQPARAIFTVVGDVKPEEVKAAIEKNLAAWPAGGEKASFAYPAPPAPKATTIYLVDKPGAAQSIVLIGLPGPPRSTPDFFPLQELNYQLGGQFQSRLNNNIREVHGYSYGVNSAFAFGKGPGAFQAGGAIVSEKTDAALIEFMKELKGVVQDHPIDSEELKSAQDSIIQSLPRNFASVSTIGAALTNIAVQGLPDDYYVSYPRNASAVTTDQVAAAAKKYIDINHLAIVIVGDRASIEAPLKATGIAPIVHLDIDGNPAG